MRTADLIGRQLSATEEARYIFERIQKCTRLRLKRSRKPRMQTNIAEKEGWRGRTRGKEDSSIYRSFRCKRDK